MSILLMLLLPVRDYDTTEQNDDDNTIMVVWSDVKIRIYSASQQLCPNYILNIDNYFKKYKHVPTFLKKLRIYPRKRKKEKTEEYDEEENEEN